ncbi:unnamed protein product, partial [Didymodactylos carnosus]
MSLPVLLFDLLDGDNISSGIILLNSSNILLSSISVNTMKEIKIMISNANPIEISIEKIFSSYSPNSSIQLLYMKHLSNNRRIIFNQSYTNLDIAKLVIPARHQAIFSILINGTNTPKAYIESIKFKTPYQILRINIRFYIVNGTLELSSEKLNFNVYPNQILSSDIEIRSTFTEPIEIKQIEFQPYGNCFTFQWLNNQNTKFILQPNKTQKIGNLTFDMSSLCGMIGTTTESTCYCGLNYHKKYEQQWHSMDTNSSNLDQLLLLKFKNLWNGWNLILKRKKIYSSLWLLSSMVNMSWPIIINFQWPSILDFPSSVNVEQSIIDFPLTQVDTTTSQNLTIVNPLSKSSLSYHIQFISNYSDGERLLNIIYDPSNTSRIKMTIDYDVPFDVCMTDPNSILSSTPCGSYKFTLQPFEKISFTIKYKPRIRSKHETFLIIRNNLTIIESVRLRGECGSGDLKIGNRKGESSIQPLTMEMNDKQYKFCSELLRVEGARANPMLQKIVILRNPGNMDLLIYNIYFGKSACYGQGFSAMNCTNIILKPEEKLDLTIRYQPDYTVSLVEEMITLHTNIGYLTYPIIVRIPQNVLNACYQIIPRPAWEFRCYWICLCAVTIIIALILTSASYDARRLYDDYQARAELRQMSTNKIFDLHDLASFVRDEQELCDQNESRSSVNHKLSVRTAEKDTDSKIKSQRISADSAKSFNQTDKQKKSINGSYKDDEVGKTSQSLVPGRSNRNRGSINDSQQDDQQSFTTRSIASSPKALHKSRRTIASTDGTSQKKQDQTKPQPISVRALKSTTDHQVTNDVTRTDNDEDSFVVATRSKKTIKTKDSTAATNKLNMITNTLRSREQQDANEQRRTQRDYSKSTESLSNDQSWLLVSSKQRKQANEDKKPAPSYLSRQQDDTKSRAATTSVVKLPYSNQRMTSHISLQSSTIPHLDQKMEIRQNPSDRHHTSRLLSSGDSTTSKNGAVDVNNTTVTDLLSVFLLRKMNNNHDDIFPCSTIARSRASSAPSDSVINSDNDETDDIICWDDVEKPDKDFGRYASQTEQLMKELIPKAEDNGWLTQRYQQPQQQKTNSTGEIPSLMSIPTPAIGLEQDKKLNRNGKQSMYTSSVLTIGRQNSNQPTKE